MTRRSILAIAALLSAVATSAPSAELTVTETRMKVRDVVRVIREDAHTGVSFIEADPATVVVLAPGLTTVDDLLQAVVRQVPSYRYETINGHAVLYSADEKWRSETAGVDLAAVTRERAVRDFIALVQRRPELRKLLSPGRIGRFGEVAASDDPWLERVTLSPRNTVVGHLTETLGNSPRLAFQVTREQWGQNDTADYFNIVGVPPLAFDAAFYGEPPAAHAAQFNRGDHYRQIEVDAGIARPLAPALITALTHPRIAVREAAIYDLSRAGLTPEAAREVRKLLKDPAMSVRLMAAEALLKFAENTGYSTVASAARDARDPNVRLSGIAGLARFAALPAQSSEAVALLATLAGASDRFVRGAAIRALASVPGAQSRKALDAIRATEHDPELRALIPAPTTPSNVKGKS